MTSLVMGFDLGGTGARGALAQLAPPGPVVQARTFREVPSRHGARGIDGAAAATVVTGMAAELLAGHAAGRLGTAPVSAVVVGCAGALTMGDDLRSHLPNAVATVTGTRTVLVCSDMLTSFLGALAGEAGVVLAVGTGAVALGGDLAGRWYRVDGWGHLLGDLGGGAWIGRAGLVAALRAQDGRPGGSEALLAGLRQGFTDPVALIAELHRRADRAALLARFAPMVLDAARAGDPVADLIRAKACEYLAETATAARPQPSEGSSPVTALATTGGLLDAHDELRAGLLVRLAPDMDVRVAAGTACDGALRLAMAAVTGHLPPGTTEMATIHHPGA